MCRSHSERRRRTGGGRRRGISLVEIMASVFVLALTVLTAAAAFPLSSLLRDRSGYASRASVILQRKVEQLRKLGAEQITESNLRSQGVIDAGGLTVSGYGFYSFNTADSLTAEFPRPSSYLYLSGMRSDLVRADIYLSWISLNGQRQWQKVSTYLADRSVWREP